MTIFAGSCSWSSSFPMASLSPGQDSSLTDPFLPPGFCWAPTAGRWGCRFQAPIGMFFGAAYRPVRLAPVTSLPSSNTRNIWRRWYVALKKRAGRTLSDFADDELVEATDKVVELVAKSSQLPSSYVLPATFPTSQHVQAVVLATSVPCFCVYPCFVLVNIDIATLLNLGIPIIYTTLLSLHYGWVLGGILLYILFFSFDSLIHFLFI